MSSTTYKLFCHFTVDVWFLYYYLLLLFIMLLCCIWLLSAFSVCIRVDVHACRESVYLSSDGWTCLQVCTPQSNGESMICPTPQVSNNTQSHDFIVSAQFKMDGVDLNRSSFELRYVRPPVVFPDNVTCTSVPENIFAYLLLIQVLLFTRESSHNYCAYYTVILSVCLSVCPSWCHVPVPIAAHVR